MKTDILIIGTGSLAKSICYSLAILSKQPLAIVILGRDEKKVKELVAICNARSAISDANIKFIGRIINWENEALLAKTLVNCSPLIILHTASLQSAWEFKHSENAWSKLVKTGGYGVTILLQSYLVYKIAQLIKKYDINTIFINACYPDAVNPLLKALGIKIICGVGNIGIIAAALKAENRFKKSDIKLLAHHLQVLEPFNEQNNYINFRLWQNGVEIINKPEIKLALRTIRNEELNQVTGCVAAKIVLAFTDDKASYHHLPGPNGLPGGYPAKIYNREISLDLPTDITEQEAIEWNIKCAEIDGVVVDNNKICFGKNAAEALDKYDSKLAQGVFIDNMEEASHKFIKLREKLVMSL